MEEDINKKQLDSLEKLNSVVKEQTSQIEKVIMKCFEFENEEETSNRFVPEEIFISQNGECALFYNDADEVECDDLGEGFAMFLIPKLLSHFSEDCLDYILGHKNLFIEKELYGGSI